MLSSRFDEGLCLRLLWAQVAEARGARDAAALLRAAEAGALRLGSGCRDLGSGQRPGVASAAPSAPPLPPSAGEQQAGARLLAYPHVYMSTAPSAAQQGAASAAGAAQDAVPQGEDAKEEAPASGMTGVLEAVAAAAWLPVRAAVGLGGQAAGWARWAATWDEAAAAGQAAEAAGAQVACDGASGAARSAGRPGEAPEAVSAGGACAGCGSDASGKAAPAAERAVPRRFGLPEDASEGDSDCDDGPGDDAGPSAYMCADDAMPPCVLTVR